MPMAGGDTLASLGEKITNVFVTAFGSSNPSMSLVFLPFAVPAPNDIVQGGIVNPTRMTTFLVPNFDAPFLMSASQYTVHGKDVYYGSASQIYSLAVNLAQPTAAPDTPAWKRVISEIAMAQSVLNPTGIAVSMSCVPDDWVSPDNASYWSTFDSTQVQGETTHPTLAPTSGGGNLHSLSFRAASPTLWTIKPEAAGQAAQAAPTPTLNYIHAVSPAATFTAAPAAAAPAATASSPSPAAAPHAAAPVPLASFAASSVKVAQPSVAATAFRPVDRAAIIRTDATVRPVATAPGAARIWRRPYQIDHRPPVVVHSPPPPPPPPPPAPTSSMSIHFQYMSVTIGYMAAGIPVWNGVLLADANWCVPGMAKGGLLPAPDASLQDGHGPLAYGLPISLIVVKDLTISVKWSGQDKAALGGSGGFIGPFSLAGATPTSQPDGSWNYTQPGMQVVALLCSHLPVLPPQDAPDLAQANAVASGASSAATAATSPPSSPSSTAGATGNAANAASTGAVAGASGASSAATGAANSSAGVAGNAANVPATSAGAGAAGASGAATASSAGNAVNAPAAGAEASGALNAAAGAANSSDGAAGSAGNTVNAPAASTGARASSVPGAPTAAAVSSPASNTAAASASDAANGGGKPPG
jgi:hypothetical protein